MIMATTLTIDSLNCRGLGDKKKRRRIFNHFFRRGIDIILLQETHTTQTTALQYKDEWKKLSRKHTSFWNSLSSRACGVAILIRDQTKTKILNSLQDDNGRIITLQFKCFNDTYQTQTIYAPSNPPSRPLFFQSLENYVFPDGQIIAGGDFNMVENPLIDRSGGTLSAKHTRGLPELQDYRIPLNLVDMWRELHPDSVAYSWSSLDDKDIHSRLDRFYLSNSLRKSFLHQHLFANPWSDHRTLSLATEIKSPVRRGKGWFKLNTALLEEDEYVDLVRSFLRDWLEILPTWSSIQQWWVEGKNRIKIITLDYCYQQSRLRKQKIKALNNFLQTENKKPTPDKQYIADVQEQIAALKESHLRGTMIRSREDILIDGEKPTRYFYAQERIKKNKSTITELFVTNQINPKNTLNFNPNNNPNDSCDDIIDDIYNPFNPTIFKKDADILHAIKTYYSTLYTAQNLDVTLQDQFIDNIDVKLPEAIKAMMDADIQPEELHLATHLFKKDRTPGIDGLPIEFYLAFWDILQQFFPRLINDIYINGLLPSIQQRMSIITLVHKKGEKDNLDNWRPISLLCVDYKILEKVLSLRLKGALPHIIGEDQTCGVQGRSIFENLYTLRDTITYANDHKIPAYIISLDFEKAFDKVDHVFLAKTLSAFGFGSRYTNHVISSNSNSSAIVSNNGFFTSPIALERGIKQGGQQSSQHYDLIAEVLAIAIRKNPGITGIHLPGKPEQLKLSLYVDDNNSILTSKQSIINLFETLEHFRQASGCNINIKKSQGLTIGGAAIPDLPFPINWNPDTGVKILGVYFFNNFDKTQKITWEHVKQNIENRAETLSTRNMSFYGKRIIINSLLLSKAWHVATVIPSTKETSTKINTIIFSYLFANKKPQNPAQDILKLDFHHGGIRILDFDLQQKSLRLNRLQHIFNPNLNSTWLILPRLYLGDEILRRNNNWMFLASPTIPKIHYADPMVRYLKINIPFYLHELLDFLRTHKHKFLRIKTPTTHLIYNMFLKDKWAKTVVKSEHFWNAAVGHTLPLKDIWTTTYKSLYQGKYLDTYYWFLSNALPSGHKCSVSKRPYENHCRRCHRYETTYHIFVDCPFARNVWNNYFYVYAQLLNSSHINYNDALFSILLPKEPKPRRLLLTVTTVIVHELWRARCQHRKQDIPTNSNFSTRKINAKLISIHLAYFKKSPDYAKHLCLPSPICKLNDHGTLSFYLPTAEDNTLPSDSEFTSDNSITDSESSTSSSL